MRLSYVLCAVAVASGQTPPSPGLTLVEQRFNEARKHPPELYAILLAMPKGADLHMHLGGAIYAETYLRFAAEDGLCVDRQALAIVAPPLPAPGQPRCGGNLTDAARVDNALASSLIDSLSMRNFVPGKESGHDHFFAAFDKNGPVRPERGGELLGEVIRRAADQNESYLEVMSLGGATARSLAKAIHFEPGHEAAQFDEARSKLTAGLAQVVASTKARVDFLEQERKHILGCDSQPDSSPCRVAVRHIYTVLREWSREEVFAQVLTGFALASEDPRVVAVNIAQPEDGLISMRDYSLHMQMFDYAKKLYPQVHLTLHAGELAAGLVPPEGLRFHIREAVERGHAERIGHGVDVMWETDAVGLLNEMKQRRVMVEISLTSNDWILGVRGKDHPFPVYRKYGVPVALSTDDEGVSRTHLTQEYLRATVDYGLRYFDLKDMARNSLEYSFAPGRSFWRDGNYRAPVVACAVAVKAPDCQTFLKANPKAALEADLEERFRKFEK